MNDVPAQNSEIYTHIVPGLIITNKRFHSDTNSPHFTVCMTTTCSNLWKL